jgi:F0F1-type ATP synthase membrane subunit b/b'
MTVRRPLLLLLVLPLILAASVEEGGHGKASLDFLGKVVNSLVLFGGLALVLRKPFKALLAKRTADVGESLHRAEAGRSEAEARAGTAKAKLAGLAAEVGRLKAEAEAEARRESQRIAEAAALEAERLKKLTRQELDAQVRGGVGELKAYAAARAAGIARERIRRRLTPEAQSALIDKSIDRLSKLHEKPGPR